MSEVAICIPSEEDVVTLLQRWEEIQKQKKELAEEEKILKSQFERIAGGEPLIVESSQLNHPKYKISIKERRVETIKKEGKEYLKEHHPEFFIVKYTSYVEVRRILE